jgi:cell division transport system permease protein
VVSVSLVLFLLGLLGLLLMNASEVAKRVRENFAVQLILKEEVAELDRLSMQKELALATFVKEVRFVSKEQAAEELKAQLDEDFVDFLGFNPLRNAFDLRLKAEYVTPAQLVLIERDLEILEFVESVSYDKPLLELMNDNIRRLGLFLLIGTFILLIISIALINSSIRLSIYSRRFLIKTMQLVGATSGFIRRPFLKTGLIHGILGSLVATLLLTALLYSIFNKFPDAAEILQPIHYALAFVAMLILGILISWICTYFAVRRYLSLKTDELYY